MQVSWIDAELIKSLVAQIEPQTTGLGDATRMVELHTVPVTPQQKNAEPVGFAVDWLEPALPDEEPNEAEAPPQAETLPPEPMAELHAPNECEEDEPPFQPLQHEAAAAAAAALPLSRIRDKLRAIRQRASEAGILTRVSEPAPAPEISKAEEPPAEDVEAKAGSEAEQEDAAEKEPTPPPPAFNIPQGSRDVRLAAFAGWTQLVLRENCGQVLVMSDDGEVLWGGEARAGLVLSTMMAWGAAVRASAMSACEPPPAIHQNLASGNVLTVIPCETSGGMVHAAVSAPEGLTHEQAHILRGALCAVMN